MFYEGIGAIKGIGPVKKERLAPSPSPICSTAFRVPLKTGEISKKYLNCKTAKRRLFLYVPQVK